MTMKFQLAVAILMVMAASDVSAAPSPIRTPAPAPRHAGPAPRGPVTYTVGDSMGWTVPRQGGATAYQAWASSKTFVVGDILDFNFIDGIHDVAEVTKSGYDSCNQDTLISHLISYSAAPPVRITLTTPGLHYFTCTVPDHCSAGQQLAITVAAATSSAAAPPPSDVVTPPPSSKASPPPSTASSPPPSSTGSAPLPSTGTAPSPSKASPPPSYITTPSSASASPTPSAQSPSGAPFAAGPSPPLPGNVAASMNANIFSKTGVLSQLGIILGVGFVQQLFM